VGGFVGLIVVLMIAWLVLRRRRPRAGGSEPSTQVPNQRELMESFKPELEAPLGGNPQQRTSAQPGIQRKPLSWQQATELPAS
jgi:hypothetical protein